MKDTERRLLDFHYAQSQSLSADNNKLGHGTVDQKVDHALLEQAEHLSTSTTSSLRSIVEDLAQLGYEEGRLLGDEFLEKFHEFKIAGVLVANFAEQLKNDNLLKVKISPDISGREQDPADDEPINEDEDAETEERLVLHHRDDEDYQNAREELISFLKDYAKDNGRTLSSFLQSAKRQYPHVNFYQMFTEDLDANLEVNMRGTHSRHAEGGRKSNTVRALLEEQINQAAALVVNQKYRALFEGVADNRDDEKKKKERKKGFILDYIFRRVINVNSENKVGADHDSAEKLVNFLSSQGYELENLYMVLYSEINEMRQMKSRMQNTRESVKKKISGIILEETPYPFLEENFDFDAFFHGNITPLILEARAKKIPADNLRLVDITKITPTGMAEVIVPDGALKPVKEKYEDISESEAHFVAELRKYFNYEDTPSAKLSDAEVLNILQGQLGKVRELIKFVTDNALKIRKEDDPIREDCKFMDEIINCNDIRKLIRWMIDPKIFIAENKQHEDVPYKLVRHQARKMFELLLFYRKHAFAEEFKQAPEHRDELEQHMRDRLKISNEKPKEYKFRIVVPIDADGNEMNIVDAKGRSKPAYEVSYVPTELDEADGEETIVSRENSDGSFQRYHAYPVETKKFIVADAEIPNGPDGPGQKVKLIVYAGKEEGKLMHCKSEMSYLSSLLRGKLPTDLIRWSIVANSAETSMYVRTFLYENYSSSGSQKISDRAEGRNLSEKKQLGRSEGSAALNGEREFTSAMYATLPERKTVIGKDGQQKEIIDHHHIGFETQIYDLNSMLIYNISDYTVSSHGNVYTPEREFGSLFEQLFPPILYGESFAKYQLEGFNHQYENDKKSEAEAKA
jgi:hypothetical protein